jgi:hypothetical protein
MLSDSKIRSLKIEDGKRHADRDGLVMEIRLSGKKVWLFRFQWQKKLTFQEIAERWHQKNAHRWKPVTGKRHLKSIVRDIYPFIGNKPIDGISKAELLAIIYPHELKGHHEVAHRLHDRLETIFEFAVGASSALRSALNLRASCLNVFKSDVNLPRLFCIISSNYL